jgi:hypothetical protein
MYAFTSETRNKAHTITRTEARNTDTPRAALRTHAPGKPDSGFRNRPSPENFYFQKSKTTYTKVTRSGLRTPDWVLNETCNSETQ